MELTQDISRPLTLRTHGVLDRLSRRKCLLIVVAISAIVFLPIAFLGIPDGYDLMQHMRFALAYKQAILIGEIVPKWAGYDNFGFGSIGVRYYPPLAYASLALTRILTGDWYTSFWLTAFVWITSGCIGMYLWIREWSSNLAGLAAAFFYAIIPFHTFEIYQAVLFSEFAAAGVLPFCFLFLTRMCRGGRWTDVVFFSASYAVLVLTHIPTAIIGTVGLGIYAVAILDRARIRETVIRSAAAFMTVLAATCFHLAKALPEVDWVQHNSTAYFSKGYYDYKSYLFPIYFSAPAARYVEKLLWNFDVMIVITLVLFAVALIAFLVSRDLRDATALRSRMGLGLLLSGGASILMLSVASRSIWDSMAFLQKIQFPWRWLAVVSLATAALLGLSTPLLLFKNGIMRRHVMYPLIGLVLATLVWDISQNMIPSTPLSRSVFEEKIENAYNEEGCDCWWPVWAKREALDHRDLSIGTRVAKLEYFDDEHRTISVSDGEAATLRVPTFYHPYWTASLNDAPVSISRDENGAITIPVPSGATTVTMKFVEPTYLVLAAYISLVAWIALAGFVIWFAAVGRRTTSE